MKNLASVLAYKYLSFNNKDKNISFMIKVCFLGIFIGTFSLMLTLIITNGFEKVIHEKMQGINAHVVMYAPKSQLDYTGLRTALEAEFGDQVCGISASSTRQAIIDRDKTQSVIFLKGIDQDHEHEVSILPEKITAPAHAVATVGKQDLLSMLLQDNNIIIGHKTAEHYGLQVGDTLTLLIPEPGGRSKIFLNKKQVVVSGIFSVGLEEYDNNLAFTSLDYFKTLYDDKGVDHISLKVKKERSFFSAQDTEVMVQQALKMRFPHLVINSWKELYPALVASLKLEKYVMFFILALITLVACMNMISLLFMQIQQKRRDIAIFRAMGMSRKMIQSIFVRLGVFITFWSAALGLGLAACVGFLLERYPFIELPDVYYVSHLPARMDAEIFLVVFIATMLLGFLATWLPARRSRTLNVAQVLRQE
ncbi:ABC transporter permease [Candidatus Babeliales bacterium]|nr:ABC transporter permease [Candidatus Babeliales bacterium]